MDLITLALSKNFTSDAIEAKADKTDIVQSDWNQNDENAIDYIRNRPFYEGEMLVTYVEGEPLNVNGSDGEYRGYIDKYSGFIKGIIKPNQLYNLTFDGVLYENIMCYGEEGSCYLGITEEDFYNNPNIEYPCSVSYTDYYDVYFIGLRDDAPHTIKIEALEFAIKQIDAKYIPNIVGKNVHGIITDTDGAEVTDNLGAEIFNDYTENKAIGQYSHAEGQGTIASGNWAHTEGLYTTASGEMSHAEGHYSTASGTSAHAEGGLTVASGNFAHAEGNDTTASGYVSHAEGEGTLASSGHQHVQGKYNVEDTSNTYAHIVGNGEANNKRSNAHTLDWDGNAEFAGDVKVNACGGENPISLITLSEDVANLKESGTGGSIAVDDALSETSTNPVQNKVVAKEITQLSESMNNIGGTIEVTSGEPTKENTVVTISPSSETTNIYTTEEVDAKLEQLSEEKVDYNKVAQYITPEMFGAVGDGTTDDSVAIQTAIDTAGNEYPVYLGKKNYKISTGLVLSTNYMNFRCDGTITYNGTDSAITLTNIIRSTIYVSTIYAENGTAIKLTNESGYVKFNDIKIDNIRSCKVGIHLTTPSVDTTKPIYYNKISYMDIVATEIGINIEPIGYLINENRYYGGTIGGGCYYGIKIGNSNAQETGGTGANKFLSGGIEGIAENGYGVYLDNSSYNIFRNIRMLERYGLYSFGFKGDSRVNSIEMQVVHLSEIDISELGDIGNDSNVITTMRSSFDGGTRVGERIEINGNYGFVYDTKKSLGNSIKLSLTNFPDAIITAIDNYIYTSFQSTVNSLNGATITLGEVYYGIGSMIKGVPVVFWFGNGTGRIKLVDTNGDTIFDASDGKFDNKTISVQWNGYDSHNGKHIWLVGVAGEIIAEETDPTVPEWAKQATKPSYTPEEVGADERGTAESKVSAHNTSETAHNDIRLLVEGLATRLNALADSDDTTLDQMSEIVAYIKSNKTLIENITTNKVNVLDIIDNLTTSVTNKPLSAKQGVVLKGLIDAISIPTSLKNPYALQITLGSDTYTYDGSEEISVTIEDGNGVAY